MDTIEVLVEDEIEIEEVEELHDPTWVERPSHIFCDEETTRPFACQELAWLSESTDDISTARWI